MSLRAARVGVYIVVCVAGCAARNVRLHPGSPIEARDTGARAIVEAVVLDGEPSSFVVELKLDAPATGLREARLASSSAAPCGGAGPAAAVIQVGGTPHWQRPVAVGGAGTAEVKLAFPSRLTAGPRSMDGETFVDLELVDEGGGNAVRCLRVPLSGEGLVWKKTRRWSVGANVWLFPPFHLSLAAGFWLGPVRLGADVGVASSSYQCHECKAGATYLLFPIAPTIETWLYRRSGAAVGVKLAYDGVPAVAVSHAADALFLHGPRAELRWLALVAPGGRLPHGPQVWAAYVSAIAARWSAGDPRDARTFIGLGFGWDFGL